MDGGHATVPFHAAISVWDAARNVPHGAGGRKVPPNLVPDRSDFGLN